jgi:hypothetical protein
MSIQRQMSAKAERLSIPQLKMAIQNGTVESFIGIPLLQQKVKQHQQAMAMQQAQQQQGQQQAPVAQEIMQQADQYRGIDELPTNLPTEEDERATDGEYANGGIIAFAGDGSQGQQVRDSGKSFWDTVDPNQYKTDPAYKAFADSPDITDKTYKNYLELGNTPPLTEKELQTIRHKNAFAFENDWLNSPEGKKASIQAQQMGEPKVTLPSKVNERSWTEATGDPKRGTEMAEYAAGLSDGDYARMQAAQANPIGPKTPAGTATPVGGRPNNMPLGISPDMLERLKGQKEQFVETMRGPAPNGNAGSFNLLNPGAVPPSYNPNALSNTPKRMTEAEAAQAEMLKAEAASPMGVAALPNAQNVQTAPGQRGASTTAPASGAGGEKLTPKVGLENAPSTLAKAEAVAGKSPAAAQALSMLDEFIADLKKSGQNVSRDKKEALYMALITGGLAAAGGTSPNALANIAAGMVPALQGYSKDIAGIRKDDRARLEKLVAAGISKEKIGLEAKKLGITEKHFDQMYNAKIAELGIMSGSRADMKRLSVAQGIFKTLTGKMNMPTDAELDAAWEQSQRMAGMSGASPKITDVVADYFPGNAPDKRYVPK